MAKRQLQQPQTVSPSGWIESITERIAGLLERWVEMSWEIILTDDLVDAIDCEQTPGGREAVRKVIADCLSQAVQALCRTFADLVVRNAVERLRAARTKVQEAALWVTAQDRLKDVLSDLAAAVAQLVLVDSLKRNRGRPEPIKALVWDAVEPHLRPIAIRHQETVRRKSKDWRDLLQEFYQKKFAKLIEVFEPERGVPFFVFAAAVLPNHIWDSGRGRPTEGQGYGGPDGQGPAEPFAAMVQNPSAEERFYRDELREAIDTVYWRLGSRGYRYEEILAHRLRFMAEWTLEKIAFFMQATRGRGSVAWAHTAIHRISDAFAEQLRLDFPDIADEYEL